jgi:hypothetical protein
MTKAELLRALEPFTDETEIMIGDRDRWFETQSWQYGQRLNGNGVVIIELGARILLDIRYMRAKASG